VKQLSFSFLLGRFANGESWREFHAAMAGKPRNDPVMSFCLTNFQMEKAERITHACELLAENWL